jgi:hypothetical protein
MILFLTNICMFQNIRYKSTIKEIIKKNISKINIFLKIIMFMNKILITKY